MPMTKPKTTADFIRESRGNGAAIPNGRKQAQRPEPPSEPWAPTVPFNRLADVPPFPIALLPPWLAEWVLAEAEATQTPPDLAGAWPLRTWPPPWPVECAKNPPGDWSEPANLFTVVSLPPGDRKSAVFAHATAPLLDFEASERQRHGTDHRGEGQRAPHHGGETQGAGGKDREGKEGPSGRAGKRMPRTQNKPARKRRSWRRNWQSTSCRTRRNFSAMM